MVIVFARLAFLATVLLACSAHAAPFVVPQGASEVERKRLERFQTFPIRGVCGDRDLDSLVGTGVNTVRGYTIPSPAAMREKLDHAHRLGLKLIVSEYMPHQGTNKPRSGKPYEYDYNVKGDEKVAAFIKTIEAIGDHPAILMWGLGNEVPLEEPYLAVVNRMSKAIHERFPHHITSLTIVNAKPEKLELVKKFAPDIDVLGVQCYSLGAVRGAIKSAEQHWGKPFYMSEFNTNGPWHVRKSEWGDTLDEPVTKKVSDLKNCYAAIEASPLCLGSTIFLWGHATFYRPTYFSLLLDPNPNGPGTGESYGHMYRTPQAEAMIEHFTGKPPEGNRAPILSSLQFEGGASSRLANPGESMKINFAAEDPNGDTVEFVTWILDSTARPTNSIAGPFPQAAADHALITAPSTPGQYLLMVYAIDKNGGASASTLAFKVPEPK